MSQPLTPSTIPKPTIDPDPTHGQLARFFCDTLDYISQTNNHGGISPDAVARVLGEFSDAEIDLLIKACEDIWYHLPSVYATFKELRALRL